MARLSSKAWRAQDVIAGSPGLNITLSTVEKKEECNAEGQWDAGLRDVCGISASSASSSPVDLLIVPEASDLPRIVLLGLLGYRRYLGNQKGLSLLGNCT